MVAICVRRANLSLMVQVVTVVRYATRDRSSLSNCSPPSYNKMIRNREYRLNKCLYRVQRVMVSCKHTAQNRMMLSCQEEAPSLAGLSGLINKSLLEAFHHMCVSVMWCDVMHTVLGATLWPSPTPHPAERAFEDGLLHFNRYQAGHQAGQCVVDNGREGRLVRRQR